MQCRNQVDRLAIYIRNLQSLGDNSKGEHRMKAGCQSRYQMLHLGLYCINPATSGREIKRSCSFPAAIHLSCCRRCAPLIPLNKYISLRFLDLRARNVYAPPVGLDSKAWCGGQEQYCKPGNCLDTNVSMGCRLSLSPLLLTLMLGYIHQKKAALKLLSILCELFPCSTLTMRHR